MKIDEFDEELISRESKEKCPENKKYAKARRSSEFGPRVKNSSRKLYKFIYVDVLLNLG